MLRPWQKNIVRPWKFLKKLIWIEIKILFGSRASQKLCGVEFLIECWKALLTLSRVNILKKQKIDEKR